MKKLRELIHPKSKIDPDERARLVKSKREKIQDGKDYFPTFLQENSNKKSDLIYSIVFMDFLLNKLGKKPMEYKRDNYLQTLHESIGKVHDTKDEGEKEGKRKNERKDHIKKIREIYTDILNSIPTSEKKKFAEVMAELEDKISGDNYSSDEIFEKFKHNEKDFFERRSDFFLTPKDAQTLKEGLSYTGEKMHLQDEINSCKESINKEQQEITRLLEKVREFSLGIWIPIMQKNKSMSFEEFRIDSKKQGYFPLTLKNLEEFLDKKRSFGATPVFQNPDLIGANVESLIKNEKSEKPSIKNDEKIAVFNGVEREKIIDDFQKETKNHDSKTLETIDKESQTLTRYKNQLIDLKQNLTDLDLSDKGSTTKQLKTINQTLTIIKDKIKSPLPEPEEHKKPSTRF